MFRLICYRLYSINVLRVVFPPFVQYVIVCVRRVLSHFQCQGKPETIERKIQVALSVHLYDTLKNKRENILRRNSIWPFSRSFFTYLLINS